MQTQNENQCQLYQTEGQDNQQNLQKLLFAVKKSLIYLSIQDLPLQILLVSREFNSKLKQKVRKIYFFNLLNLDSEENFQKKQRQLQVILGINNSDLDYLNMLNKVDTNINIQMIHYEKIINIDVQRTLQIHLKNLTSSVLQNLLHTYAFYNQEIGYFSGMNYLMRYLFVLFNNEQLAYRVFDKIMERNFKKIWSKDFEDMKVMFYVFEQLVNIFLPKLGEHLRLQEIETYQYLPQWIITIYSCALQYTAKSSLLNIVWDMFLVESWKGFYKSTLFILYLFQDKILQMNFDSIVKFLSELIQNEIFMLQSEYQLIDYLKNTHILKSKSIKQNICEFKITNKLISRLHRQYQEL